MLKASKLYRAAEGTSAFVVGVKVDVCASCQRCTITVTRQCHYGCKAVMIHMFNVLVHVPSTFEGSDLLSSISLS
jgi:hypothetical protein